MHSTWRKTEKEVNPQSKTAFINPVENVLKMQLPGPLPPDLDSGKSGMRPGNVNIPQGIFPKESSPRNLDAGNFQTRLWETVAWTIKGRDLNVWSCWGHLSTTQGAVRLYQLHPCGELSSKTPLVLAVGSSTIFWPYFAFPCGLPTGR